MIEKIIKDCEQSLKTALKNQISDPQEPHYGGFPALRQGVVEYSSVDFINLALSLYLCRNSVFYQDKSLLPAVDLAFKYAFRWVLPDGTHHYLDCNFFTAPGFEVQNLAKTYYLLEKYGQDETDRVLKKKAEELMLVLAEGFLNSGFHTPNHRWIYSGALAIINSIHPDPRYTDKINTYLLEGIDFYDNGQFAERSIGTYNQVCDGAMMLMGTYLNRPEFFDYVEKNLELTLAYMEPDFSLFTMNSTRQDYGNKIYADLYFPFYLEMAKMRGRADFYRAALDIFNAAAGAGRPLTCLQPFLLDPELDSLRMEEAPAKKDINGFYPQSGVARLVRGEMTFSLLQNSPTFFFARFGSLECFMRMGVHFFNARNVIMTTLEKDGDSYRMHYEAPGLYLLPYGYDPGNGGDWWAMDQSKRPRYEAAHFNLDLELTPTEKGVKLHIVSTACERVPVRFEIGVSADSVIKGEGFMMKGQPGMELIPTTGFVRVENETDAFRVGPAFGEHLKTSGRAGNEPKSPVHTNLFFTANLDDNGRLDKELFFEKVK